VGYAAGARLEARHQMKIRDLACGRGTVERAGAHGVGVGAGCVSLPVCDRVHVHQSADHYSRVVKFFDAGAQRIDN
jgi:hypothetical protein